MEQDANKTTSESEPSIKSFGKKRVSVQNSASKVFARRLSIKKSTSTSAPRRSSNETESHSIKCVSYHRHDESSLSDSEQKEITQEWDNLKARNAASEEFTKSVIEARTKSLESENTILSPNFYTNEDDDSDEDDSTMHSITSNTTELAELGTLPDDTLHPNNQIDFKNDSMIGSKNSNITHNSKHVSIECEEANKAGINSRNEQHRDGATLQLSNSCTSQTSEIDKTNFNQNQNSNSQISFESSNATRNFSALSRYDSYENENDIKMLTERPLLFKLKFWACLAIIGLVLYLFSENLRFIDYLGIVAVGSVFMYIFWSNGCCDDSMLKKLTEVNKIDAGYSRVVPKMKKRLGGARRKTIT